MKPQISFYAMRGKKHLTLTSQDHEEAVKGLQKNQKNSNKTICNTNK